MPIKKTLIMKVSQDVSHLNDTQIEIYKDLLRAGVVDSGLHDLSFELTEADELTNVERLLQSVRSEFAAHDASPEIAEKAEKNEHSDESL